MLEIDDAQRFGFTGVRQAFRIRRDREQIRKSGSASTELVCGITSAAPDRADAGQLLEWNRGHRAVEANHPVRDPTFGEDTRLTRTGNGPGNRATCNSIALALIIREARFDSVPAALRHFSLHRNEAFEALLTPTRGLLPRAPTADAAQASAPSHVDTGTQSRESAPASQSFA